MEVEYRTGYVFIQNAFAGVIRETDAGYSFVYDEDYIQSENPCAVSLTMPIDKREYVSTTLFSFFDGLIPEGWLLEVASRNWKIERSDRFGLLLSVCRDCIGDVSIRNEVSV
ncbi:MAG: HipA N-terminal domain-containing protein [Suipraeoptans sp.]